MERLHIIMLTFGVSNCWVSFSLRSMSSGYVQASLHLRLPCADTLTFHVSTI